MLVLHLHENKKLRNLRSWSLVNSFQCYNEVTTYSNIIAMQTMVQCPPKHATA